MLTLTPERLPVTVYRSSDSDAPILDRSPNCVATIFKACLVTGYGDKQPAGWTLPFEDNDKGIKVLRPKVKADTDFYQFHHKLALHDEDIKQSMFKYRLKYATITI